MLIQVDGNMPNRALMVTSAFYKKLGNEVYFRENCDPDIVYLSCIFPKNRSKALGIATMYPQAEVYLGGSGINYDVLPHYIEYLCPDYDLINICPICKNVVFRHKNNCKNKEDKIGVAMDYSMGFTSRGCIRNCPWCIVPKKEGNIRNHQFITDFLRHDKVILFDNNFLASPKWRENIQYLIDRKIKVSFNQGLDIRLVDNEVAKLLKKTLYKDGHFKNPRLYFAFDYPQIEKEVVKGIKTLNQAGIPSRHLMFYILIGFNTTYEEDLHRIKILIDLDVLPFIMVYNNRKDSYYPHLARWIDQMFYQFIPWEEYDHGNSQEIIKMFSVKGV